MKIICETLGYRYSYNPETGMYCVDHEVNPEVWYEDQHPLIAWGYFWGAVDMVMRRRIKPALEKRGLNGWTGLPVKEEKPA